MINFNRMIKDDMDHPIKLLFKEKYNVDNMHLVHTCTAALEIAALALDLSEGDEVIIPSFTFVSTANAFALRGVKLVYCDVDASMNMDVTLLEDLITKNTRAIVPVHYGGFSCDMDTLMSIAEKNNLIVIEDAAQAINSFYKGRMLGTIGHLGCLSFHHTKNIHCYEGGAIFINDPRFKDSIDMIVEKGTDRILFDQDIVHKYTWKKLGSSYLMDVLRKRFLYDQLSCMDDITNKRLKLYDLYSKHLRTFKGYGSGNGHLFFIVTNTVEERKELVRLLMEKDIDARSHYEPLDESPFGHQYKEKTLKYTQNAHKLLRLPLHENLEEKDVLQVIDAVKEFYNG